MTWQNLLDYDPGTGFVVYIDGEPASPEQLTEYEISVLVTGPRVTLSYVRPAEETFKIELMAVPSTPLLEIPVRLLNAEGDTWDAGDGNPFASQIEPGDPAPVFVADLGAVSGVTYEFPVALELESFGMGVNVGGL